MARAAHNRSVRCVLDDVEELAQPLAVRAGDRVQPEVVAGAAVASDVALREVEGGCRYDEKKSSWSGTPRQLKLVLTRGADQCRCLLLDCLCHFRFLRRCASLL